MGDPRRGWGQEETTLALWNAWPPWRRNVFPVFYGSRLRPSESESRLGRCMDESDCHFLQSWLYEMKFEYGEMKQVFETWKISAMAASSPSSLVISTVAFFCFLGHNKLKTLSDTALQMFCQPRGQSQHMSCLLLAEWQTTHLSHP